MRFQSINPKYYYKLFVEVIKFLIKPTPDEQKELENRKRIRNTVLLFLISLFIGGIVNLLLRLMLHLDTNHIGMSKAKELYNSSTLLFIGVVLFPLLEEIAFRLFLKFKPIYLFLSTSVLVYYIVTKLIYHTYNTDLGNNFELRILLSIIAGVITYFVSNKYAKNFNIFWKNKFRHILYFSILSFGLIHIFNYKISLNTILLAPIITFHQLFVGAIFSFIRVKYGFIYNFSIHSLSNFIALSILLSL